MVALQGMKMKEPEIEAESVIFIAEALQRTSAGTIKTALAIPVRYRSLSQSGAHSKARD